MIKDKEKYGVINSDGKIIVYPLFEQIGIDEDLYTNIESKYIIDNKYIPVKQNGKWGVIDIEGNIVVEPKYEFKDNERPDFLGEYYKVTYGFGEFYYTK